MRTTINKLKKGHSTKAERKFSELLKSLHIPFRYKVKIEGREIDFIVGNYAIEIDGHTQDVEKNYLIIRNGYNPIHYDNNEISSPNIKEWLKDIWQEQVYLQSQKQSLL